MSADDYAGYVRLQNLRRAGLLTRDQAQVEWLKEVFGHLALSDGCYDGLAVLLDSKGHAMSSRLQIVIRPLWTARNMGLPSHVEYRGTFEFIADGDFNILRSARALSISISTGLRSR